MMEVRRTGADALAQQRTELAVTRTVMAADRTLMAWTRTSLAMISFGFTVYKFMQYLNFGIAMIAAGILFLLLACLHYWHLTRKVNPGQKWHFSLALVVASFVVALGFLALINAAFRIGPF
jgi:putative membrane protein